MRDTAIGIRKLSTRNEARLNGKVGINGLEVDCTDYCSIDALRSFRAYLASDDDPKIKAKELEIYKKVRTVFASIREED